MKRTLYDDRVAEDVSTTAAIYRNAKDFVFHDLFQDKRNILKVYQAIHPEDQDATVEDIGISNVRSKGFPKLENDLCFTVRRRRIILVEAQSNWSDNIALRNLIYLLESYWEILEQDKENAAGLYGSKAVFLPDPEAYVIYPFFKEVPEVLSLAKVHFQNRKVPLEFQVKVLKDPKGKGIIGEYILFCRIFQKLTQKYGRTKQALDAILKECSEKSILVEYLSRHKEVFYKNNMDIFNEEVIWAAIQEVEQEKREKKLRKEVTAKVRREITAKIEREVTAKVEREVIAKAEAETKTQLIRKLKSKEMADEKIAALLDLDPAYIHSIR